MANLGALERRNWNYRSHPQPDLREVQVGVGVSIKYGAYVGRTRSTGLLGLPTDVNQATFQPMGIAAFPGEGARDVAGGQEFPVVGVANAGGFTDDEAITVVVDVAPKTLYGVPVGGASAITDEGDLVYCTTDNLDDLTTTAPSNQEPIGYIEKFHNATTFDVRLYGLDEMTSS